MKTEKIAETEILNQLLQGQRELLSDNNEVKRSLKSIEKDLAQIKEELEIATEVTAYLSRDVLLLKNRK